MHDPDATVALPRPQAIAPSGGKGSPPPAGGGGRKVAMLGGAVVAVLGAAGGTAWYLLGGSGPGEPPPKPETPSVATAAPPVARAASASPAAAVPGPTAGITPAAVVAAAIPVPAPRLTDEPPRLASEEAIFGHRAALPTVFRLAANPRVFVIDFPDLELQGATFNRVAALVEKIGQPRDRVLGDIALASAIASSGDTPATYYYGHNYRGRELERFFALADRDGVTLNPAEQRLRDEVALLRRLVPTGEEFAVISVPGIAGQVDATMRRAILHHEIGHGHFFTNPVFAAHVARVWREVFTESERARFRAFLSREGYDPTLEEVMVNEAMAYLIFTPDERFFTPAMVGLTPQRADQLRAALRERAPL